MISQSTIEEVKQRASLSEIVGDSVALRRQGSSVVGLCPFHEERTPSFHIRDDQFFHCFGCGESGNVFSFIMRLRGLSFPEAVEELAARYAIEVKHEGGSGRVSQKIDTQALYRVQRLSAGYFFKALQKAPPVVQQYLQERHLSSEALKVFGIGYAPDYGRGLREFLQEKKISQETIDRSGLLRRNQSGEWYDTFRARLMFPIFLDAKRIAGFGGRIIPKLGEQHAGHTPPKYLNSSESPIYQKNKIFYGLPQASSAIRTQGSVYLVEGYLDVVGLWQVGVRNVLATCGTAVTPQHVQRLSRLCNRLVFLFDGDAAGRNAAGKAFAVFLNSGVDVSVIFLPEGEDPDTLAHAHQAETTSFLEALPKISLLECYIEFLMGKYGVSEARALSAAHKGKVCEELATQLATVQNSIEQGELIQSAALTLLVEPSLLEKMVLERQGKVVSSGPTIDVGVEKQGAENSQDLPEIRECGDLPAIDQQILLAIMAQKESLTDEIIKDPDLTQALQPITVRFVVALHEIIHAERAPHGASSALSMQAALSEEKKESIRRLLTEHGESWLRHWKKAHEMLKDPNVNFPKGIEECRISVRKFKLVQAISLMEQRLKLTQDETERLAILQEKLLMDRQLRGLGAS